jgi:hypothetical protein
MTVNDALASSEIEAIWRWGPGDEIWCWDSEELELITVCYPLTETVDLKVGLDPNEFDDWQPY